MAAEEELTALPTKVDQEKLHEGYQQGPGWHRPGRGTCWSSHAQPCGPSDGMPRAPTLPLPQRSLPLGTQRQALFGGLRDNRVPLWLLSGDAIGGRGWVGRGRRGPGSRLPVWTGLGVGRRLWPWDREPGRGQEAL